MSQHTFKQPRSLAQGAVAIVLGVLLALLVFFVMGVLVNLFSEVNSDDLPQKEQTLVSVTEDFEVEPETPPEEAEDEVEELEDSAPEIELDIPTSFGTGGIIIDTGAFNIGDGGGDLFDSSDLDTGPRPKLPVQPQYPSSLKKKGVEGRVLIELVVDSKGAVVSAKVKSTSGHKAFDDAALKAAKRTKFKPAIRGGKPVKAKVIYPISFKLNKR